MTNNINPDKWGHHGWVFLHYITLSYPVNPSDTDKIDMKNFFSDLQKVLPCESCRNNFSKHLLNFPLNDTVLSTRSSLVEWLLNIHNCVNVMTGKSKMDINDAVNLYITEPIDKYTKIICLFLILLVMYVCYRKYY